MEENNVSEKKLRNYNMKLSKTISVNIRNLYKSKGWSQSDLCTKLSEYGLSIDQNTLSKYIPKDVAPQVIPVTLVLLCCKIFNVSIEEITSADYLPSETSVPDNLLRITCKAADGCTSDNNFIECIAKGISKASNRYIVNSNDEAFNGYFQQYSCYLYPTLSSETNPLTAELELKNENGICRADFHLNTGRHDTAGIPIYKHYAGLLVIVEKTRSCYIILSSVNSRVITELCFLNFRYIPISDIHRNLDCRMVEVLTTSAGGDSSFPTLHRMFISRLPIKQEDLSSLLPHLYLNNSKITIEENELIKLAHKSDEYKNIVKTLISLTPIDAAEKDIFFTRLETLMEDSAFLIPEEQINKIKPIRQIMYVFKEDLARNTAGLYLPKNQIHLFISNLRMHSYKVRYNKVSNKLDENVRKMLIQLGYYSYGQKNNK